MIVKYSRRFLKQYYKLSPKIQERFQQRLNLWQIEPDSPLLGIHFLSRQFAGYYSLNVTGDIRALYHKVGAEYVLFGFIGSHSQLYR